MAPADIAEIGSREVELEKQMIITVIIEGRMRLVHPMLIGPAVILRLVIVLREHVLQPDILKRDFSGPAVHKTAFIILRNLRIGHDGLINFHVVDKARKHIAGRRRVGGAVVVPTDVKPVVAAGNFRVFIKIARADLFAVEIHRHHAVRAVESGGDVIPFVFDKRMSVVPQSEIPVPYAHLETPRAVPLIAEDKTLVGIHVILADNRRQMFLFVGGGVRVVPFKHPGRHPGGNGERISRNPDILVIIADKIGISVHEQRTADGAALAPLRVLPLILICGICQDILHGGFVEIARTVFHRVSLALVESEMKHEIVGVRVLFAATAKRK